MDTELDIKGDVREGIPLLEIYYPPSVMFLPKGWEILSDKLTDVYKDLITQEGIRTKSCVVWIKSATAGSPMVRALFELFKIVDAGGGTLYCADFPEDYMAS